MARWFPPSSTHYSGSLSHRRSPQLRHQLYPTKAIGDALLCFFFLNRVSVIGKKNVHSRSYCLQWAQICCRSPFSASVVKISQRIFFERYNVSHESSASNAKTTHTSIARPACLGPLLLFRFRRTRTLLPLLPFPLRPLVLPSLLLDLGHEAGRVIRVPHFRRGGTLIGGRGG